MSLFNTPDTSWKELQKDSENFQKPIQYTKDFEYDGELEAAIRNLLQLYASNQQIRSLAPQLRLYVNQNTVDIHTYFNATLVIKPKESIEDWGKRVFKGQDYILVINCVERFSETLSSHFANSMVHRLKNHSPDEVSYRISLFIGNSGFTPFGAHIDLPGLDVTHFHLGPGSKSMTLWEESKFQTLINSTEKHCYDYEKHIHEGNTIQLNQGDILFFPADKYYHVGEYHNFSIAAAVGLMKESPLSMFTKAMSRWKEDTIPIIHSENLEKKDDSISLCERIPEHIRTLSIQEILEEYTCKKASNAFMHHRPLLKKLIPLFLIGKELQVNSHFHIVVKDEIAYARGRKWNQPLNAESRLLLLHLIEKKPITCSKEMSEDTLRFATWLFNTGAIIFC